MENLLLGLEQEIINGQENAKKAKELYQLLSSYNAYSILLLNAKREYEKKKANTNHYYSDSSCYEDQIDDLFSLFKNDEFLNCEFLSETGHKDMLFLIDNDTLLRINSFEIMTSSIVGLSSIDYKLLRINNCIARVYREDVYCGDPYYCDRHWEKKDAFGLFYKSDLITPGYKLENQFKSYNGMDIRDILKVQSLDEIHEKINEAKNEKVKKLTLTK